MKKKMINGLLVGLFAGVLGFCVVSEAVDNPENNYVKVYGMGQHRKSTNDKRTGLERKVKADELTKEESIEISKIWEKPNDYSNDKRENTRRNHMGRIRKSHHGRMNNSCW